MPREAAGLSGSGQMRVTEDRVTVAVDVMGGDHAPREILLGALEGASRHNARVLAVGDRQGIERYLRKMKGAERLQIIDAPEQIQMGENPASAIRRKPNSSLVVAAQLVRDGKADAMLSAGNTGACMAVAALILGRAPGIDRPGIATVLPTARGQSVLLDVGANVDSTVENLVQFAVMGSIYSRDVLGVKNPRVGLLSIGEEPTKGNELTKAAHKALLQSGLDFVGNVEGGPLFAGAADVVVCDGFVGNVALKVAEGVVELLLQVARARLWSHPWYRLMLLGMAPGLRKVHRQLDRQEVGGAPLLGVNGICIVCHGNSKAKSIISALGLAARAHEKDMLGHIRKCLEVPADIPA